MAGICFVTGYPPVQLLAGPIEASTISANFLHYFRRYQATAYITFLSVNIFSRDRVGFAYARVDEENSGHFRKINLQFRGSSIPERAHGLNRFGLIQEAVKECDGTNIEASYFGLITANGEQSLSEAKAALETKNKSTLFVAAAATIDARAAKYSIRHVILTSAYHAADAEQLLGEVRASFNHPEEGEPEHHQSLSGDRIGTFLYSLREALMPDLPNSRSDLSITARCSACFSKGART